MTTHCTPSLVPALAWLPHERTGQGFGLIPFLVDPQGTFDDVYCFDRSSPAPEYRVSVFAIHAEVHAWPNFAAWAAWLTAR
jgi:hypothetical protein